MVTPIPASRALWLDATRCLSVASSRRPSLIVSLAHLPTQRGSRRQVRRDSRCTDSLTRQPWPCDWLLEREALSWPDEIPPAHQSPWLRQVGSVRRQIQKTSLRLTFTPLSYRVEAPALPSPCARATQRHCSLVRRLQAAPASTSQARTGSCSIALHHPHQLLFPDF